ncbi:MAG TPA: hypothetical protein VF857_04395 [Spirochaetota bacterium]
MICLLGIFGYYPELFLHAVEPSFLYPARSLREARDSIRLAVALFLKKVIRPKHSNILSFLFGITALSLNADSLCSELLAHNFDAGALSVDFPVLGLDVDLIFSDVGVITIEDEAVRYEAG